MDARKVVVFLAAIVCASFAWGSPEVPDWENQQVVGINKLDPYAWHWLFTADGAALRGGADDTPLHFSLNGVWDFLWAPDPASRPQGFEAPGYGLAGWDQIKPLELLC